MAQENRVGKGREGPWAGPDPFGPHTDPHAGPDTEHRARHPRVLDPGVVLAPVPAPGMPATGAERGPHPPAPPYGRSDRRLAQEDWERWRAENRRRAAFLYPDWRT